MAALAILRPEVLHYCPLSAVSHLLEAQRDVALLRLLDLCCNADSLAAPMFVSVPELLHCAAAEIERRGKIATAAAVAAPPLLPSTPLPVKEVSVIYEVVRVRQGRPLFLRGHVARLLLSIATEMQADSSSPALVERLMAHATDALERDWSHDSAPETACVHLLEQWIRDLIAAQSACMDDKNEWEQNVKIVLWRSAAVAAPEGAATADSLEPGSGLCPRNNEKVDVRLQHFIARRLSMATYFIRSSYPPPEWYRTGVGAALLYHAVRDHPNAKIAQQALRQRAARQQASLGVHESLLTREGRSGALEVTEGSRSNLIVVDTNGCVTCAPATDILLGITLLAVRRECRQRGIPFEHRTLTVKDLVACSALAMTGTSPGVLPLSRITVFSSQEEERALLTALGFGECESSEDETTFKERKAALYRQAGITTAEVQQERDHDAPPQRCGWLHKASADHPIIQTLVDAYSTAAALSSSSSS